MRNLIIMSIVWLATAFGYYLVLMLVNTFEKIYFTGLVSSLTEITAYILSGMYYERIGVKTSLTIGFAISTIGGCLILSWGLAHQTSVLFFVFFLLAKFGITCTFNIHYMANGYYFPT